MQWNKYTIHTVPGAEEAVSALLLELGVEGVEIEDGRPLSEEDFNELFIDLLPELAPDDLPPDDGTARVIFYLRTEAGESAAPAQEGDALDDSYTIHDKLWSPEEASFLLEHLRQGLEALREQIDIGEGRIDADISREEEWRDSWKAYFRPEVMDGVLIRPSWEAVPEEYRPAVESGALPVITMDPGTAFGTGTHESTRLCLDAMEELVRGGECVLDIGCGSGILGFYALKRGAASVTATELDPACEGVIRDNLALNQTGPAQFRLFMGNLLAEEALKEAVGGGYDIIAANILTPVIVALAAPGQADRHAKSGAWFITSGIIAEKGPEVEAALRANPAWEVVKTLRRNAWVSVIAKRR
ncbi:MAG: 50S ribosomal protein L11 methyltransferase [Lachnospiraceae bacterium]|nr:50S ribosomal protein L11 methyltransferase [Lachnospiraceae bacterium]